MSAGLSGKLQPFSPWPSWLRKLPHSSRLRPSSPSFSPHHLDGIDWALVGAYPAAFAVFHIEIHPVLSPVDASLGTVEPAEVAHRAFLLVIFGLEDLPATRLVLLERSRAHESGFRRHRYASDS